MRFLIVPFFIFILSFVLLRSSGVWSTKQNWKRIGLESGVALGAAVLTAAVLGFIIVFFN